MKMDEKLFSLLPREKRIEITGKVQAALKASKEANANLKADPENKTLQEAANAAEEALSRLAGEAMSSLSEKEILIVTQNQIIDQLIEFKQMVGSALTLFMLGQIGEKLGIKPEEMRRAAKREPEPAEAAVEPAPEPVGAAS